MIASLSRYLRLPEDSDSVTRRHAAVYLRISCSQLDQLLKQGQLACNEPARTVRAIRSTVVVPPSPVLISVESIRLLKQNPTELLCEMRSAQRQENAEALSIGKARLAAARRRERSLQ